MEKFMKLGIISYGYQDADFAYIRNKDLDYVEFCINDKEDAFLASLQQTKQYLNKYNLHVASIGRWGTNRIEKTGLNETELTISYQLIDACNTLGCPVFIAGCNYVDELSYYENITYAIEYFQKLIAYGKTKNVKIAIYNCRWNNYIVDDATWNIVLGHLDELYLKYDPSHCIYDGSGDYLNEIKKWGHRIVHFHLKGALKVDGERIDDPPAGLDITDWESTIALLVAKGYKGVFSIEPHSGVWTKELGERGIAYTINYFKKFDF